MADKFIPDGDSDFAWMARSFSSHIEKNPSRFDVSAEDAAELVAKVQAFRDAMAANQSRMTSCKATQLRKDAARAEAVRIIRDIANRIRINRKIGVVEKSLLRIKQRPTRMRRRTCPQTPPVLRFAHQAPSCNALEGRHILKFFNAYGKQSLAKPEGAVRLELFVDLVPPGDPIPTWPGERWGGRMWYHRSYTRSPIVVDYPKCDEQMRVVYWARWAAASGETGPFSKTLAARVEGFDRPMHSLPDLNAANPVRQSVIITTIRRELPALAGGTARHEHEDPGVKLLGSDVADAA